MAKNNEKLTAFATAIGTDIKRLTEALNERLSLTQITEKLSELEAKIKSDLFGGDVTQAYDTFKEIADKLEEMDGSVALAITEKINELKTQLTELQAQDETDLVAIYQQAKGA